jgi:hypothetical protein
MSVNPEASAALNTVFGGNTQAAFQVAAATDFAWPGDPQLGGGELSYDPAEAAAREVGAKMVAATPEQREEPAGHYVDVSRMTENGLGFAVAARHMMSER